MNKKLIILIALFAIAAAGSIIYFGTDTAVAAETNMGGETAVAGIAAQSTGQVSAEGVISPLRSANLSVLIGGNVAEILAEEGSVVAAGDPILRLEAADLALNVQQAQAGVTSAEAALSAAQAQLALAQAEVNSAEISVTVAQAQLDLTVAGPRPEEITAAEKNLAAAEAGVAQAAGSRDAALDISNADIQAAQAEVAEAAADLRLVQDGYDDIINGCYKLPDDTEVCPLYGTTEENTRAQLEIAQLQLNAAQAGLDALLAGPTTAQQRAAGGSVAVAAANRALAQAQLDLLLAGATPEQIRQAEVAVEQAELGVEQAQTAVTQAEAAVTQAEAGVVQAQAGLAAAQKALDRMTLTAPFDGTVVSLLIDEGELASTGVPIVVFSDVSGWLVETTDLTELDVAAIAIGDQAEVRIDAIDDEVLSGTITKIAAVSTLTRGDVTYAVTVELDANTLPLRWGMTAFVNVN